MNRKSLIWIGMIIGTTVGSFVPALWGEGGFTMSSIFFSTVGGVVGIWVGYRLI
jgi:hypothetical protein